MVIKHKREVQSKLVFWKLVILLTAELLCVAKPLWDDGCDTRVCLCLIDRKRDDNHQLGQYQVLFSFREIQVATGEWADAVAASRGQSQAFSGHMPILRGSKNAKLIIPPAMQAQHRQHAESLARKNVKRSWTISSIKSCSEVFLAFGDTCPLDPTGTTGPQMRPRNQPPVRKHPADIDPDLKAFANENVPPPPKIAPPIFLSVPAPPPPTTAPPPVPGQANGSVLTRSGRPIHHHAVTTRNVPLRTQSMSQADTSRFHLQKYRHPVSECERGNE